MMDEQHEENGHFKMRLDEESEAVEEQEIPKEINELKLEKISHRVTLISILIPVLIVIVLVFTYLDIKRRVVQTEDTGAIEFKKLSSDLESRFGSLSVRQARIEDGMARLTEQTNQILASIQVRLEKLDDSIKKTGKEAVGQKEFDTTRSEMVKKLNSAIEAANDTSVQMAAISEALKTQIDELRQSLADTQPHLDELEGMIDALRRNKLDKEAMDLALRIETMKVENALKMQMDDLRTIMKGIDNRLHEVETQQKQAPKTPKTSSLTVPAPKSPPAASAGDSAAPAGKGIEEQSIKN